MKTLSSLCVASALWGALLGAQQSPAAYTVHGVVRRGLDSLGVPAAAVTLDSSRSAATSDATGRFVFQRVTAGTHILRATHEGFVPAEVKVFVSSAESSQVVIALAPVAVTLPAVRTRETGEDLSPRYRGIRARVARNGGALFTADDIARENPIETKHLLEKLPGVHVTDNNVIFAGCQSGSTMPSTFNPHATEMSRTVQVYVDGMRLTSNPSPGETNSMEKEDANGILALIKPSTIQFMEVYTGLTRVPPEYSSDACAVVVIWTKAQ